MEIHEIGNPNPIHIDDLRSPPYTFCFDCLEFVAGLPTTNSTHYLCPNGLYSHITHSYFNVEELTKPRDNL